MSRATAVAPANIAFVKYWGARDLERAIPCNPSISMTLSACVSHSTVEHLSAEGRDEVLLADADGTLSPAPASFSTRVTAHLARLRREAGVGGSFRVATRNSFPTGAGIASSASGFAALTVAVTRALGLELDGGALSRLAQMSGSGSASRSVMGGYVEWPTDLDAEGEASEAQQLATASHWELCDLVAIVESGPKKVSSLEGHQRSSTSPYYETRQTLLPERLRLVREAIAGRDVSLLGPVVEAEAIDLHLIAMSSQPAIFYWNPTTLEVLAAVRQLREDGVPAYSTLDAGANVHVICEPASAGDVRDRLSAIPGVRRLIEDRVGDGPICDANPLF